MLTNFAIIFGACVTAFIIIVITIAYFKFIKSPAYLEQIELKRFRDNLIPGVYVKIEHSDVCYKVVLVHPVYVQLHHPQKGFSGHPKDSIYPVDYEF